MKITGVGRYLPGGILYYISIPQRPMLRVQREVHRALCDIAQELGCPDLTMVGERQPPVMWQRQCDLILSMPEPDTYKPKEVR
jgi:hypothetical protein